MWVVYAIVMLCLAVFAVHVSQEWWRDFKRERREQREWDIDARRRSLRIVR